MESAKENIYDVAPDDFSKIMELDAEERKELLFMVEKTFFGVTEQSPFEPRPA